jgi:hypothetical protein
MYSFTDVGSMLAKRRTASVIFYSVTFDQVSVTYEWLALFIAYNACNLIFGVVVRRTIPHPHQEGMKVFY